MRDSLAVVAERQQAGAVFEDFAAFGIDDMPLVLQRLALIDDVAHAFVKRASRELAHFFVHLFAGHVAAIEVDNRLAHIFIRIAEAIALADADAKTLVPYIFNRLGIEMLDFGQRPIPADHVPIAKQALRQSLFLHRPSKNVKRMPSKLTNKP